MSLPGLLLGGAASGVFTLGKKMAVQEKINLSLDVSPKFYATLNELAEKIGGEQADVLRKAIALMQVAVKAEESGKHLWIVDENKELDTEIIGISSK